MTGQQAIWKYPLKLTDEQQIMMPVAAQILHVDKQGDTLTLWALVDATYPDGRDAEHVARTIEVHGTGNPISGNYRRQYIGTVLMPPFVWHVFERLA